MYENGRMITRGTKDRVYVGPLGVRKYIPIRCENGYTLFSQAFGYTEYLMDMNGMIVHTWPVTHSQLAELLPDGNLLADNYGSWLQELRPDGSEIWRWDGVDELKLTFSYHHDFCITEDGSIFILVQKKEPIAKGLYKENLRPDFMLTDMILKINRKNEILWKFSFSEHIEELSRLSGLPLPVPYAFYQEDGKIKMVAPADWAHTNTIEALPDTPLGREDDRFKRGNLLFSLRHLDIIGIIDPDKNAIVWCYGLGVLDGQHQPTMLKSGNILIFDNGTYRGYSAAREINPLTGEIVWEYIDRENFYSPYRGGVQRLSNGNTLICESDAGHIFEVTPDKELVWDFYSPFLGQGRQHQGRHVYRATRYSGAYIEPLIRSRGDAVVAVGDENRKRIETYSELIKFYQRGKR